MKKTDVENALMEMGMSPAPSGFKYITAAVMLLDTPEWENGKFIALYLKIGKDFNSTGTRVERAIRHAFDTVRTKGNEQYVQKYIGQKHSANSDTLKHFLLVLKRENAKENNSTILKKNSNNEPLKKLLLDIETAISDYMVAL